MKVEQGTINYMTLDEGTSVYYSVMGNVGGSHIQALKKEFFKEAAQNIPSVGVSIRVEMLLTSGTVISLIFDFHGSKHKVSSIGIVSSCEKYHDHREFVANVDIVAVKEGIADYRNEEKVKELIEIIRMNETYSEDVAQSSESEDDSFHQGEVIKSHPGLVPIGEPM